MNASENSTVGSPTDFTEYYYVEGEMGDIDAVLYQRYAKNRAVSETVKITFT